MKKWIRLRNKQDLRDWQQTLKLNRKIQDAHDRLMLQVRGLMRVVITIGTKKTVEVIEVP